MEKIIRYKCLKEINERIITLQKSVINRPVIMAIDGRSASGKTTLSKELADSFGGGVVHMDDFYLPLSLRTKERFSKIGGNIHQERFNDDILKPLSLGKLESYIRFSPEILDFDKTPVVVNSDKLVIIEGAYSMHPAFGKYYDFSLFLDIDKDTQVQRIIKRNGSSKCKEYIEKWIPFEERYISFYNIDRKADYKKTIGNEE